MKKFVGMIAIGLVSLGSVACDSGEDRLRQEARIQGGIEAGQQVAAENANLERRIGELSDELARRQEFYQEAKGVYEGLVRTNRGEFRVRLTLIPSIPAYERGRVRSLSEIEHDLTNLSFNLQVILWNPASPSSAVGCRIQGARPDLTTRELQIASEDCPNAYFIRFGAGTIEGEIQPSTHPEVYTFSSERRERIKR